MNTKSLLLYAIVALSIPVHDTTIEELGKGIQIHPAPNRVIMSPCSSSYRWDVKQGMRIQPSQLPTPSDVSH